VLRGIPGKDNHFKQSRNMRSIKFPCLDTRENYASFSRERVVEAEGRPALAGPSTLQQETGIVFGGHLQKGVLEIHSTLLMCGMVRLEIGNIKFVT